MGCGASAAPHGCEAKANEQQIRPEDLNIEVGLLPELVQQKWFEKVAKDDKLKAAFPEPGPRCEIAHRQLQELMDEDESVRSLLNATWSVDVIRRFKQSASEERATLLQEQEAGKVEGAESVNNGGDAPEAGDAEKAPEENAAAPDGTLAAAADAKESGEASNHEESGPAAAMTEGAAVAAEAPVAGPVEGVPEETTAEAEKPSDAALNSGGGAPEASDFHEAPDANNATPDGILAPAASAEESGEVAPAEALPEESGPAAVAVESPVVGTEAPVVGPAETAAVPEESTAEAEKPSEAQDLQ